jgi:hypothetical protein
MDELMTMTVGEIINRLKSHREETFFVNTTVKVVSVAKSVKEGDKWRLGSVRAKDREKRAFLRVNLWGNLSFLVNELGKGDILKITNGQAKNYSYNEQTYPQINCDDRYAEVSIKYKREKILVDGSNVAWMSKKDGKPNIDNIEIIKMALCDQGYDPIVIVDASLRHLIPASDRERFEKWIGEERVIQAPAQVRADEALLKFAEERGLTIVSNDTFREYREMHPWITDKTRRIPFTIIGTQAILHVR